MSLVTKVRGCTIKNSEFKIKNSPVVFTNHAQCRDCYRCIRVCPVHAIGIREGQAFVDADQCIACGTCIRECPQQAKQFRRDLDRVKAMVARGDKLAVTLAPSFAALFESWEVCRVPSALRQLGFSYVAETAVGAYWVAKATAELMARTPDRHCISSACPAVVNYILHHRPNLAHYLAPIASPMTTHARMIKQKLPNHRVVFIGPCVAKKAETDSAEDHCVDAALTFVEWQQWMTDQGVDLAQLEESRFDETPDPTARTFALPTGCMVTAAMDTGLFNAQACSVSGMDEVTDLLDTLNASSKHGLFIEPLFCRQGCINGPAMNSDRPVHQRLRTLMAFQQSHTQEKATAQSQTNLDVHFKTPETKTQPPTEQQIRDVLARTGKEQPADQLNCGACGYATCRDQAKAVLRGMAEADMCIPYMRRLAEKRTDRIVETSPNGIVILDEHLAILHMNPSFRKLFMCSESLLGKGISILMDPQPFTDVINGVCDLKELTVRHTKYNLITHQVIYALPDDSQIVGVFVNMTHSLANKKQLDQLRQSTLQQARDLLDHQVTMAGQIAQFLGQSTSESERLLQQLARMAGQDPNHVLGDSAPWQDDTTTST